MSIGYSLQLSQALDILEQIKSVSSSNQKADLLRSNSDNFILKSILFLTYNPFLTYNVKKIPKFKKNTTEVETDSNFYEFIRLLHSLSNREVTGNNALDLISELLSNCSKQEQEWYPKIIQKDLKIGLADKGINRVFKDLVPIYEVLLAEKIYAEDLNLDTEKAYKVLPERIVCQYKIDGFRLNIFVYDDFVL